MHLHTLLHKPMRTPTFMKNTDVKHDGKNIIRTEKDIFNWNKPKYYYHQQSNSSSYSIPIIVQSGKASRTFHINIENTQIN